MRSQSSDRTFLAQNEARTRAIGVSTAALLLVVRTVAAVDCDPLRCVVGFALGSLLRSLLAKVKRIPVWPCKIVTVARVGASPRLRRGAPLRSSWALGFARGVR